MWGLPHRVENSEDLHGTWETKQFLSEKMVFKGRPMKLGCACGSITNTTQERILALEAALSSGASC